MNYTDWVTKCRADGYISAKETAEALGMWTDSDFDAALEKEGIEFAEQPIVGGKKNKKHRCYLKESVMALKAKREQLNLLARKKSGNGSVTKDDIRAMIAEALAEAMHQRVA